MQIGGRDLTEEMAREAARVVASLDVRSGRREVVRAVCEALDWRDARGHLSRRWCSRVVSHLEQIGWARLPVLDERPEAAVGVPRVAPLSVERATEELDLEALGAWRLEVVEEMGAEGAATFKELLRTHHYLGDGPLCGARLRYLVISERLGVIGALAFSAPARRLGSRDRWIGWSEAARIANLKRIVCNSRFLLVPTLQVKNLASSVLAQVLRRLRQDWLRHHRVAPVLVETFVDARFFSGTCYRAANWRYLGRTAGRGRQDRDHRHDRSSKLVFAMPLIRGYRKVLAQTTDGTAVAKPRQAIRQPVFDWAEVELGAAGLGDKRLDRRLVQLARGMAAQFGADLPQAMGDLASTRAAYRFFENELVTMESILRPHREHTVARMAKEDTVLLPQDGTSMNFTAHPRTVGIGPLGSKTSGGTGFHLHDMVAFTPGGTPLGVMHAEVWSRDFDEEDELAAPLVRTYKSANEQTYWKRGYLAASEAQARCPSTRLIVVGDRGADDWDLWCMALPRGESAETTAAPAVARPHLLIRSNAARRRRADKKLLRTLLLASPAQGTAAMELPRRGETKRRTVELAIRWREVTIQPPADASDQMPRKLHAVMVSEVPAPQKRSQSLEWILLTTVPITNREEALECVGWYRTRWSIEVYHRTLKSGCRFEARKLESLQALAPALALDLITAWRVTWTTMLGREKPNLPCDVVIDEYLWKTLVYHEYRGRRLPAKPPTMREFTRAVAGLGGYLGRKGDGPPGVKVVWRGLNRLEDMAFGAALMWSLLPPGLAPPLPDFAAIERARSLRAVEDDDDEFDDF